MSLLTPKKNNNKRYDNISKKTKEIEDRLNEKFKEDINKMIEDTGKTKEELFQPNKEWWEI